MNKEFTNRDSATAYLRKNKIQKNLYNNFITKINDKFVVNIKTVEDFCSGNKLVEEKSVKNTTIKPSKEVLNKGVKLSKDSKSLTTDEIVKKVKVDDTTISSLSRELILAGKTNKEIWEIIKAKFKLDDNKKHYPAWYRSEMKRSGKLK